MNFGNVPIIIVCSFQKMVTDTTSVSAYISRSVSIVFTEGNGKCAPYHLISVHQPSDSPMRCWNLRPIVLIPEIVYRRFN